MMREKLQRKTLEWGMIGVLMFTFSLSLLPAPAPVESAAPSGFQTEQLVNGGLNGPSGFEIAPDGRVFILERTGAVKINENGNLLSQPFVTLPSIASGDRGLIGVAFDPDFASNHYVYFYYTGLDLLNHLVRFDASNNTVDINTGVQIYATTSLSYELHVGGSIAFGLDGKLYFAIGDNGFPPNAQDLTNPHGKILRINKDGTVPADNPFVNVPGAIPEIWAFGFRNPWRFQFDQMTGRLYVSDVGNYTWEEVNLVIPGGNYGWPVVEGLCQSNCQSYIDPIHTYNHNGEGAAVTGGPVYYGSDFPAEYQGDYFFADYTQGFIRTLELEADGSASGQPIDFDPTAGTVVDLKVAPDGSLYYITFYPGRLYRVRYNPDNPQPVVEATADPLKGVAPLDVNFSSAGTFDPNGDDLTYLWDFGDGTTSTDPNPTKTYTQNGAYTVELTVSDGEYSPSAIPIIIQVGLTPTVNISVPAEGTTYHAGDTITYNAFATDGAGFDMNDAQISTEIVFHHNTHTHPFLGPLLGRTGSFSIPTTGEAAVDTWFRIIVTATDDNGLFTTEYRDIFPETSNITYDTSPSGIPLTLDGIPVPTPTTVETVVGYERYASAPISFTLAGTSYKFQQWSDSGTRSHFVAAPENDATFVAEYDLDTTFSGEYFNNQTLSGVPVLTRDDTGVHFNWGTGSPDPQLNPDNFSVRWTANETFDENDYRFTLTGDDGVRLYIDGELVIDGWINQSAAEYEVTKTMTAGQHTIVVEYFEGSVNALVDLTYFPVEGDPGNHLGPYTAEFWSVGAQSEPQIPLTAPDLTREDAVINFDWGLEGPDPQISNDGFVSRWTNQFHFDAGDYQFFTESDDGIRVFVDGVPVIDEWNDHAPTLHNATVEMTEGLHTVVVEHYDNQFFAVAKFWFERSANHTHPFTAEYWNLGGPQSAPQVPTTVPDLVREDEAIDFNWGLGSPDPSIDAEGFVARWSNHFHLTAGDYQFNTESDDGIRVYVDGEVIIDQWNDHSSTVHSATITLAEGTHDVVVEYYENHVDAVARFWFENTNQGQTDPFNAEYWSITPQTAPAMPTTPANVTRLDNTINFNWGLAAPNPLINTDGFIARWTNHFHLSAGDYQFFTESDDGIRVFVDETLIIDQWNDHSLSQHSATLNLIEGTHDVRVEFYENRVDAVARFWYEPVSQGNFSGFGADQFAQDAQNSGEPSTTASATEPIVGPIDAEQHDDDGDDHNQSTNEHEHSANAHQAPLDAEQVPYGTSHRLSARIVNGVVAYIISLLSMAVVGRLSWPFFISR